jgi:hypothetical protein
MYRNKECGRYKSILGFPGARIHDSWCIEPGFNVPIGTTVWPDALHPCSQSSAPDLSQPLCEVYRNIVVRPSNGAYTDGGNCFVTRSFSRTTSPLPYGPYRVDYWGNLCVGPDDYGIRVSSASGSPLTQPFVDYNTVVDAGQVEGTTAIDFGTIQSGGRASYNVAAGDNAVIDEVGVTAVGNAEFPNPADAGFVNYAGNDFHLASGSTNRNAAAATCASFTPDIDGLARPQGAACDRGAYEFDE